MKKTLRFCDNCKKEIPNMYDYGVTTLYRDIRIGRGSHFHDYTEGSEYNVISNIDPDNFDGYGKDWQNPDCKEFSFCCPQCLISFYEGLLKDVANHSLALIKDKKNELDVSYEEFKKKIGEKSSFFKQIQTMFSKTYFKEISLKEIDRLEKELKEKRKELEK